VLIAAPRGSGGLRVASAIGMLVSLLSLAPVLFLAVFAHGPMPGA
jgi:hypothetical protein